MMWKTLLSERKPSKPLVGRGIQCKSRNDRVVCKKSTDVFLHY